MFATHLDSRWHQCHRDTQPVDHREAERDKGPFSPDGTLGLWVVSCWQTFVCQLGHPSRATNQCPDSGISCVACGNQPTTSGFRVGCRVATRSGTVRTGLKHSPTFSEGFTGTRRGAERNFLAELGTQFEGVWPVSFAVVASVRVSFGGLSWNLAVVRVSG